MCMCMYNLPSMYEFPHARCNQQCMHAYIREHRHACMQAYLHTCRHACTRYSPPSSVPAHFCAHIHAYLQAYMHTCTRYMHTCRHTCIHAHVPHPRAACQPIHVHLDRQIGGATAHAVSDGTAGICTYMHTLSLTALQVHAHTCTRAVSDGTANGGPASLAYSLALSLALSIALSLAPSMQLSMHSHLASMHSHLRILSCILADWVADVHTCTIHACIHACIHAGGGPARPSSHLQAYPTQAGSDPLEVGPRHPVHDR